MAKKKRTTKKTETAPESLADIPHGTPVAGYPPNIAAAMEMDSLQRIINAGEQARDDSGCDAHRWETWYQDACKAAGATLDLPDVGDVRVEAERRRAFNLALKQLRRRLP